MSDIPITYLAFKGYCTEVSQTIPLVETTCQRGTMKFVTVIHQELLIWILLLITSASPLHAVALTVTNTIDSSDGSLRTIVNSATGNDTINFDIPQKDTIVLRGNLCVSQNISIQGRNRSSGNRIVIKSDSSHPYFRLLTLSCETFSIKNIELIGGRSDTGGVVYVKNCKSVVIDSCVIGKGITGYAGGGVFNENANLIISNSSITHNEGSDDYGPLYGGGIYNNSGKVTLLNSHISSNRLDIESTAATPSEQLTCGGGIYNQSGTITLTNCVIDNNSVLNNGGPFRPAQFKTYGGGIYNKSTIILDSCSIMSNGSHYGDGGGIYSTGTMQIKGSTISDNRSDNYAYDSHGGGCYSTGTILLVNSTFYNNSTSARYIANGCAIWNGGTLNMLYTTIVDNGQSACYNSGSCLMINAIIESYKDYYYGSTAIGKGSAINSIFVGGKPATTINCDTTASLYDIFAVASPVIGNNGGITKTIIPGSNTSIALGFGVRCGLAGNDPVYYNGSSWFGAVSGLHIESDEVKEILLDQRGYVRTVPPTVGAVECTPVNVRGIRSIAPQPGRLRSVGRLLQDPCCRLFTISGRTIKSKSGISKPNGVLIFGKSLLPLVK